VRLASSKTAYSVEHSPLDSLCWHLALHSLPLLTVGGAHQASTLPHLPTTFSPPKKNMVSGRDSLPLNAEPDMLPLKYRIKGSGAEEYELTVMNVLIP